MNPDPEVLARTRNYAAAVAVVTVCTLVSWASYALGLREANIVMIFLAGVALVSARLGHGPAIAAAILAVVVFDFFFVEPIFRFTPSDAQYFVTLAVMLGIGILISELVTRLREQLLASQQQEQHTTALFRESQQRERRTAQLYQMTCELSTSAGTERMIGVAGQQLQEAFEGLVVLYLCDSKGNLQAAFGDEAALASGDANRAALNVALQKQRVAGLGTDSNPSASALYVPMVGSQKTLGVIAVRPQDLRRFQDPEEQRMLQTCAHFVALSIERDQSQREVQQAQVQVQAEQVRSSLLSAVSHDLRTPLATIAATATSLVETGANVAWPEKVELLQTVIDESNRLTRQVDNLLDMARLNSGTVALDRDWHVLEEIVGLALQRLRRELSGRAVRVAIPENFPLLLVSGGLIEQMFINLLENAVRYTPRVSRIEISALERGNCIEIRLADNGPGLPPGSETRVFDKFFRGKAVIADGQRGVGLGLAICQAIAHAHGGQITAANRSTGGAEFTIRLPCPPPEPSDTPIAVNAQAVS